MLAKIRRAVVSFCVVFGLFWVYRLVASPFLDPPAVDKRVTATNETFAEQTEHKPALGSEERLFPADAWERNNPIVLESNSTKLLTKGYENLPDNRVVITPCTLLMVPDSRTQAADAPRRVIVLQAPSATLQFDSAVDLRRGKVGRLLGGVLQGPIVIRSEATRPGAADDLSVTTPGDIELHDNMLTTPEIVEFRFGPSHGQGRGLQIDLLPATVTDSKQPINFSGVQTIQLLTDVQMHLEQAPNPASTQPPGGQRPNVTADIRCQGPFDFDMIANIATFHQQVDVVRPNPGGPSDQINCELLSVLFAPRAMPPSGGATNAAQPAPSARPGTQPLEARKIEARGNPVVVRLPSNEADVRGEHLIYDLASRKVFMEDTSSQVQIQSPQLRGWLSRLEATFLDDQLGQPTLPSASPAESNPAAPGPSLPGLPRASTQRNDSYQITAGALACTFARRGGANKLTDADAEGRVQFIQLPAAAGEPNPLEIHGDRLRVVHADADAEVNVNGQPAEVTAQGLRMIGRLIQLDRGKNALWIDGPGRMIVEQSRATQGAAAPTSDNSNAMWPTSGPTTIDWQGKMAFDGSIARFEHQVIGQRGMQTLHSELLEATLHSRVDFANTKPQDRPQLETISCPGQAMLENRSFKPAEAGAPESLTRADWMQVNNLVVNQNTGDLTAPGPGVMRSWRLGSAANMQLGPPQVPGLAPAQRRPQATAAAAILPGAPPRNNRNDPNQINFIEVQYQNGLTGNTLRREFTFHEQIHSIYGPVPSWDGRLDMDNPTPGAMSMTCDELMLYEVGQRNDDRAPLNLKAMGNTRIDSQRLEGDLFSAWASEINYAQEKDLLVLQGDGRTPAQLMQQAHAGAPQSRQNAQTIYYWPSTGQAQLKDVRFGDVLLPGSNPAPRSSTHK